MNGRPEGVNERNDCVIRALTIALRMDYADVWRIAKACGRRERCGTGTSHRTSAIIKAASAASGIVVREVYMMGGWHPTLADFITRGWDTGAYIVAIRGHVFALINGKDMDGELVNRARCRVKRVWRVYEKSA